MGCHITRQEQLTQNNCRADAAVTSADTHADVIEAEVTSGGGTPRKRTADTKYFTEEEKEMIRESWGLMKKEREAIGRQLFLDLFERQPRIKQLFSFNDLHGEELVSHYMFHVHSMRFMRAIDSTVNQIDALDVSAGNMLHHLGQKHQWIDDFLEADYLPSFLECISNVFRSVLQSTCKPPASSMDLEAAHVAWRKIFEFIVARMTDGYRNTAQPRGSKPFIKVDKTALSKPRLASLESEDSGF